MGPPADAGCRAMEQQPADEPRDGDQTVKHGDRPASRHQGGVPVVHRPPRSSVTEEKDPRAQDGPGRRRRELAPSGHRGLLDEDCRLAGIQIAASIRNVTGVTGVMNSAHVDLQHFVPQT